MKKLLLLFVPVLLALSLPLSKPLPSEQSWPAAPSRPITPHAPEFPFHTRLNFTGWEGIYRVHNATGALAVAGNQNFVIPGTTNDGYPGTTHNGTAIPFRVFTPPWAAATLNNPLEPQRKYPAIIFNHGCGEKTNAQSDRTNLNTSELNELTRTQPWNLLDASTDQLWDRQYQSDHDIGGTTQVFWFGPQLWGPNGMNISTCSGGTGGYTFTYLYLTYYTIQEIKKNWSHIVDTNRISIAGLSQGGGACNLAIQDSLINQMLASALILCPGYYTYSTFAPTGRNGTDTHNWDDLAASGLPIWYVHSVSDDATTTSAYSRTPVQQIMQRNPLFPPIFDELTGDSHSLPWVRWLSPSSWLTSTPLTNGEDVTPQRADGRDPIEWLIQFSKNMRQSRRPDGK